MEEQKYNPSPANTFLRTQVYRLGSEPGFLSLPPGPERDFLVLTWGPIVYRTTYAPDSQRVFHVFLRVLNEEIRKALPRFLPGDPEQIDLLERTYSSRVFSSQEMFNGVDEEVVRESLHDWKIALSLPLMELPVRLKVCLVVDDGVLASLTRVLDLASMGEREADFSQCPVKVVEENFLDRNHVHSDGMQGEYPGCTTVALSSVVEIFDGLQRGKGLINFHRKGCMYLGDGVWKDPSR